MTNDEKIKVISMHLSYINIHIETLQKDIELYPDADLPDKPLRRDVLLEFLAKKSVLDAMILEME